MISSGVLPIIFFASFPIPRTLLVLLCTATTEGSFNTTPFPGTKTSTLVVPRSIPSFGEKRDIESIILLAPLCGKRRLLFWRIRERRYTSVMDEAMFNVKRWWPAIVLAVFLLLVGGGYIAGYRVAPGLMIERLVSLTI